MQMIYRFFLFLFFCLSCTVHAQEQFVKPKAGVEPVGHDSRGNPIYKLIDLESRFDNMPDAASPMVYQGTKSIEGEFLEMGFLGFCTATAVGPNLIYTAAHCISNGQKVNWKMRLDQKTYSGVCNKHPDYNDRTVYNDYAFCILNESLPKDTVFASFNIKDDFSGEALLNGYGAPNLGTHYWGKANHDSTQGQDIITCGPANLGGGDSGGSFLKWTIDRDKGAKHEIFGTNSRAGGGCSYFNRTNHPNFKPYAESQVQKGAAYVCGVTKDCAKPIDPAKCVDEQKYIAYVSTQLVFANDALKLCRQL